MAVGHIAPRHRVQDRDVDATFFEELLADEAELTLAAPEHVFTGLTSAFAKLTWTETAGGMASVVLVAASASTNEPLALSG